MTERVMAPRLLAMAASLLIAGAAVAQNPSVEVTEAWARATPGKAENGSAYLTLVAPAGDRLTAISTPAAQKAELHTMSTEGGIMKMRPLSGIDLPPGQTVTLKPGGTHIMLFGLAQPLRAGQSFPLTLSFDKAGRHEVAVTVEKAGAMGPHGSGTGSMPMGTMPMNR